MPDCSELNLRPSVYASPVVGDCPWCKTEDQLMGYARWLYCPACEERGPYGADPSPESKATRLLAWLHRCAVWRAHCQRPLPAGFRCAIRDCILPDWTDQQNLETFPLRHIGIIDVGAARKVLRHNGIKLAKANLGGRPEGIVFPVGPFPGLVTALFVITTDHESGLIAPVRAGEDPGWIFLNPCTDASIVHFESIGDYMRSTTYLLPGLNVAIRPVLGDVGDKPFTLVPESVPAGPLRLNNRLTGILRPRADFFPCINHARRPGDPPQPPSGLVIDDDWQSALRRPTRWADHARFTSVFLGQHEQN